ncbi:MAG: 5'-deoxynucleotidase [Lachnospiraceae bacterium]|nr:5'-deoxynucleotidase [Lachnospiraceae bacterium]
MKKYHFFGMMARLKLINRWSLMRNTREENLAEHSLEVAMIAHALAVIGNCYLDKNLNEERIALLGMYHDAAEIITGDLPTPVKYHDDRIRDNYKELEKEAQGTLLKLLPEKMWGSYQDIIYQETTAQEDEYLLKLLKAADKISAYIKCVEEEQTGNRDFSSAKESTYKALSDMNLEEVGLFMEMFMESYGLDLDTMSKDLHAD